MSRLNVSAWAIRRPVPSLVMFMVLMALGLFSFNQLPVTRFPNIDIPIVNVTITQAGAAPSELETQVTKRVEDAISGVPGSSTSRPPSLKAFRRRLSNSSSTHRSIVRSMTSRTR